jgi:hypothetical protein
VPAALTREGVFLYRNPDGSTRREYRPAAEVFKADSLASLENAPVTDLHPSAMVDTKNYRELTKGHARDVKQDGKLVAASVLVQDAELVSKVDKGERKEISCGYTCKLDMTPGVSPTGEHYDAVQRDIVYNHVALLPIGTGRAGREVALRLDAATQEETPSREVPQVTEAELKALKERADKAEADAKAAAERADKAEATAKTEKARADKAEADVKAATERADAAEAPAKKAAREKLEAAARKASGKAEEKFDGKTDDELRAVIVAAALEDKGETRSDSNGSARAAALAATAGVPAAPAVAAVPVVNPWEQPLASSKK